MLSPRKLSSLHVVGVHWLVAGPREVVLLVLALAAPTHGAHSHDEHGGGHHAGAHGRDQRHPLHSLVMGVFLTPNSALLQNITGNNLLCQSYKFRIDRTKLMTGSKLIQTRKFEYFF